MAKKVNSVLPDETVVEHGVMFKDGWVYPMDCEEDARMFTYVFDGTHVAREVHVMPWAEVEA